jgi:hypothetical protein
MHKLRKVAHAGLIGILCGTLAIGTVTLGGCNASRSGHSKSNRAASAIQIAGRAISNRPRFCSHSLCTILHRWKRQMAASA